MLGTSRPILALFEEARLIAATHVNVLLAGERGVGKHVVAQFMHENSPRRHGRMLSVDCALGGPLRLTPAHRGTLLLEDVAALRPSGQSALLAAIADRKAGFAGNEPADPRIICTTTCDLLGDAEPAFDLDLYYRLNVGYLPIPPLRERREDIPLLAKHYLGEMSRHFGLPVCELDSAALAALEAYDWPANLHELCDVAELLAVTYPARTISVEQLPESIRHRRRPSPAVGSARRAVVVADPPAVAVTNR
jgi:two-component system response regulator AtoC